MTDHANLLGQRALEPFLRFAKGVDPQIEGSAILAVTNVHSGERLTYGDFRNLLAAFAQPPASGVDREAVARVFERIKSVETALANGAHYADDPECHPCYPTLVASRQILEAEFAALANSGGLREALSTVRMQAGFARMLHGEEDETDRSLASIIGTVNAALTNSGAPVPVSREAIISAIKELRAECRAWPLSEAVIADAIVKALAHAAPAPSDGAGDPDLATGCADDALPGSAEQWRDALCSCGKCLECDARSYHRDQAAQEAAGTKAGVPAGMVPWHGGDSAPADWDGGPTLLRDGSHGDGEDWRHLVGIDDIDSDNDIVAYTPKQATPTDEAVLGEREACAALCEKAAATWARTDMGHHISSSYRATAAAIRARPAPGSAGEADK